MYYESIFNESQWALDPRPIIYCDTDLHLILNKKLVDSINENCVSHEIWLSDEVLAHWFNRWTHGISAAWIDNRGPHNGKRLGWHWVEQLYEPEKDRRAISLDIEDYRKFIWVFHLTPENYDQRLNIRKGVWPD